MTPAVSARDLRHVYANGREALRGVSFEVAPGETFGLLGPNGGGKSTLFRILSTYFPPTAGTFEIAGHTDPREIRSLIGVVFQNPSLDGKLTVEENLRFQASLYGVDVKRADELLERFRLSDRRRDLVASLSGGLKRRVELAKGLLHDPDVLLLDEPSTGLDPGARRDLWEHLESLKAAVVVTTHLMDEADRCDRLILLDEGRVVASGSPDELKTRIGGDVVSIESREPQDLRAKISAKFGKEPALVGSTLRLEMRQGHSFIPQLIEAFPGCVESVSLSKPTLDDVFISHTGRRL